jgi:hypothetical protein
VGKGRHICYDILLSAHLSGTHGLVIDSPCAIVRGFENENDLIVRTGILPAQTASLLVFRGTSSLNKKLFVFSLHPPGFIFLVPPRAPNA